MIEPEPMRPTPETIPVPTPNRKSGQIGQTEQIGQARQAGQVTRLSPELDAEPKAEAIKPRRGAKWIPEVIIVVVVLVVFFFSWQGSRTRDENLSAASPTQTPSGTESQPATDTNSTVSPQSPAGLYQQASGLNDQYHYKEAVPLYKQSCDGGYMDACYSLGFIYDIGRGGVQQSFPRAISYYTKACDAGNAIGCAGLGAMYDTGRGVRQDLSLAAALYTKGCDGGNGTACNNLGVALMHGAGVKEDKDKAREVLKRGCSLGDQTACEWLKKL
jgi:TPR repeat protein